jgi:hypothetical protein
MDPVPEPPPSPWIDDGRINRWRYRDGTNREDVDIELTQNKFAVIQYIRFDEVQRLKWSAVYRSRKSGGGVWYATANARDAATGENFCIQMHSYLFPNFAALIDHINHDGLDNRAANVRDGSGSINQRNKKGAVGAYERKYGYTAQWSEIDGTQKTKSFAKSGYETKEDAYAAALACRKENADRALNEVIARQAVIPPRPVVVRELVPRTKALPKMRIPVVGLAYVESKKGDPIVRGDITINRQRFWKEFAISSYGGDLEAAINAGTTWANQIRADNPSVKKERKNRSRKQQKIIDPDESE